MRSLYPDWRAPGLSVCLHERAGGFAFNRESMLGLADKARAAGAEIVTGIEVTGFELDSSGAVTRVRTSAGEIAVEQVVVAVGPWIASLWSMLGLPSSTRRPSARRDASSPTSRCGRTGTCRRARSQFDPAAFTTADGSPSPVLHVDSDQPLHADDGELITSEPWGVYFKPDRETIQGGAQPLKVGPSFEIDPYPTGTVDPAFPDMWSASLSHCLGRFAGARARYRQSRSGGVGAFTADNFPILDYMRPNVFVAADSNHGYKMIAIGREIARVLTRRALLAAASVPLRALRHR